MITKMRAFWRSAIIVIMLVD